MKLTWRGHACFEVASGGYRILVDRLWPRGVKKDNVDLWMKDIAPSDDLRKWFGHIPERFDEFESRYMAELESNPAAEELGDLCCSRDVVLLYAAKDEERNNAVVLKKWLERMNIKPITMDHLKRYGKIYADAFSGPPWNDPWKPEDAEIHIRELMETKTSYGLEYVIEKQAVGFILGTSMLFHYGRTFEINDLAVDPAYQRRGIATELLERCIADIKEQGIVGVHLITAGEGTLPAFYEKHGFGKETEVILMGRDL